MTTDDTDTEAAGRVEKVTDVVEKHVAAKVAGLLAQQSSGTGAAMMAHLRAAIAKQPGDDPHIWHLTIDGVPANRNSDEPSAAERAVHSALTLFAMHQRAQDQPMHKQRVGLGSAVRSLETALGFDGGGGDVSPVRKRFDALVLSSDVDAMTYRLRGLVNQLRGSNMPLDYALLAKDLLRWQFPGGAESVRRRWAREYYRLVPPASGSTEATTTSSSEEKS